MTYALEMSKLESSLRDENRRQSLTQP